MQGRAIIAVVTALLLGAAPALADSTGVSWQVAAAPQPPTETHQIYSHLRQHEQIPGPAEEILDAFVAFHAAGSYGESKFLASELVRIAPHRPEGYYNLACALARTGDADAALDALNDAIEHGWRNAAHLRLDPDLDSLRDLPQFKSLLARVGALAEAERAQPQPLHALDDDAIALLLRERVPALLERYDVPGVTIGVVREGRLAHTVAFGMLGAEMSQPLTLNDRFVLRAPFDLLTLVAAAQQQERGAFDLASLLREADELALRGDRRDAPPSGARAMNGGGDAVVQPVGHETAAFRTGPRDERAPTRLPERRTGTHELLILATELAEDARFVDYCRESIFERIGVTHTSLPAHEPRNGRCEVPREIGGAEQESAAIAAERTLVPGATQLGTLMPAPELYAISEGLAVTTADDVARIIAALMPRRLARTLDARDMRDGNDDRTPAPLLRRPLTDVLGRLHAANVPLGLAVDYHHTPVGRRIELRSVEQGVGCLIRWYPQTGDGIVVFFNSENGLDVAQRIAADIIGGE